MSDKPNPADFLVNERAGEYRVSFDVRGFAEVTIKAKTIEAARAKAKAMADDENFAPDLGNIDEVSISAVYEAPKMYLVTRNGRPMQTSRLEPGDMPRAADERGF